MRKIILVMINYNGGQMVMDTIGDLIATPAGSSYELIVVDNGSNDGSREAIKKVYRGVRVLEAGANLGFGKGINYALSYLADQNIKPEFICLIQPDMEFTKDWLKDLVTFTKAHPKAAAVMPLIVYKDTYAELQINGAQGQLFSHKDYRFSLLFPPGGEYRSLNLGKFGGRIDFVSCADDSASLLVSGDEESQYLTLYDESMKGFSFTIGDRVYQSNKFITFIRKALYKLTKFSPLKMYILKLPEVSRSETVVIVNSLGAGFRKGATLPDHIGIGRRVADLTDDELSARQIPLFYGACALLRYDYLRQVGGFDEDYFMYYEESDLSLRLRQAGYEIYIEPKSLVIHKERGNRSDASLNLIIEGQQTFLRKWGEKLTTSYIKQNMLEIE